MAGSQSPLVESTTLTIPLPTSTDLFLRGTKSSSLWDDSFTKWSTRRAEVLDVEAAAGRVGLAKAKGQTEVDDRVDPVAIAAKADPAVAVACQNAGVEALEILRANNKIKEEGRDQSPQR